MAKTHAQWSAEKHAEHEQDIASLNRSTTTAIDGRALIYDGDNVVGAIGNMGDGSWGQAILNSGPQPIPSQPQLGDADVVGSAEIVWDGLTAAGEKKTPIGFGDLQIISRRIEGGINPDPEGPGARVAGSINRRGGDAMPIATGTPGTWAVWFRMIGLDGTSISGYSEPLIFEVQSLANVPQIKDALDEARERIEKAGVEWGERLDGLFEEAEVIEKIWSDIVYTKMLAAEEAFIGGALLMNNTIDVAKLNVTEEMAAEIGRFIRLEVGSLASDFIEGMTIVGGLIEGTDLRGVTITGSTVQTAQSIFGGSNGGVRISGGEGGGEIIATDSNGSTVLRAGNGTLFFRGEIQALSGTFAGSLEAATGTFAGELSAASGTFEGELSGASGTFEGTLSGGRVEGGVVTGATVQTAQSIFGGSNGGIRISGDENGGDLRVTDGSGQTVFRAGSQEMLYRGHVTAESMTINGELRVGGDTREGGIIPDGGRIRFVGRTVSSAGARDTVAYGSTAEITPSDMNTTIIVTYPEPVPSGVRVPMVSLHQSQVEFSGGNTLVGTYATHTRSSSAFTCTVSYYTYFSGLSFWLYYMAYWGNPVNSAGQIS